MPRRFDEYGRPIGVAVPPWSFVERLVSGNLADDGVQWSAAVSTVDADTWYTVLFRTLDNDQVGELHALLLGLTLAIRAGSVTADVQYRWRARHVGSEDWMTIHDTVTIVDVGTSYVEQTLSGWVTVPFESLSRYPIQIELQIQSNEAAPGVATARVKNSSFVQVELR